MTSSDPLLDIALDAGGMACWEIEPATRTMTAGAPLAKLVGRPLKESLSISEFERCLYPDDVPAFREALELALGGGELRCEMRVRGADGRLGCVAMFGRRVGNGKAERQRLVGVLRRTGDASPWSAWARDGGSSWTTLFDASGVGMGLCDAQSSRLLEVNQRLADMLGWSRRELLGRRFLSVLSDGPNLAFHVQQWRQLARGEVSVHQSEQGLLHQSGRRVWVLLLAHVLRDASGTPARLMILAVDVSAARQAREDLLQREAELQRVRAELEERVESRTAELASVNRALRHEIGERRAAEDRVRELLGRQVEAVEEERRRIARELHDTLGQHLAVLALGIKGIENGLERGAAAHEPLARARQALDSLENQLDRLVYELRPPALDELGLEEALRSHVELWTEQTGIPAELHVFGLRAARVPPAVENTVYRVVQEALTNVQKHASAQMVSVMVERRAHELRVVIEDDGCGFDSSQRGAAGDRHFGLRGMAERAAMVAGSLEIESVRTRGTTIYLVIPLAGDAAEGRPAA